MVLLEVDDLLLQRLKLHFQVGFGQGQVVQHGPQAVEVALNVLAEPALHLVPVPGTGTEVSPAPN